MDANTYIFNQIYKALLNEGVNASIAHSYAVTGMNDYRKGKFKTPTELIERCIKQAKKLNK